MRGLRTLLVLFWGILSTVFAQQPTPPITESHCVMNCGGPDYPDPYVPPAQQYLSKYNQAVGLLRNRLDRSDRNSLFAKHLAQILSNLPRPRAVSSVDDAYYAADELASYFDGYAIEYRGMLWLQSDIDQQRQKEELMLREIESELPALQRENADLAMRWHKSKERVLARKHYGEAALEFDLRMINEERRVGLRVLKRTRGQIPPFYTRAPLENPWEADENLDVSMRELDYGFLMTVNLPKINYWDSNCARGSDRGCHRRLPDEVPDPPSYRRQEVDVTVSKTAKRIQEIDPSRPLGFLEQLGEENSSFRRSAEVWSRLQSVGLSYGRITTENQNLENQIARARGALNDTYYLVPEAREDAIHSAADCAFWWFLDHLMVTTLHAAKSNDAEAMPHLRKIGAAAIKFANGELDLTRETVSALANGNPVEIQTLQNLMQEKLCDFKNSVDQEVLDSVNFIPEKLRPLLPARPRCR